MPFTEADFWAVIAALDYAPNPAKPLNTEAALQRLLQGPDEHLAAFEDALSVRLHALDTPAHALCFVEDDYLDVDYFLYMRCGAIARGQAFYEAALAQPTRMADLVDADADAEEILYLAEEAYMRRHGPDADWEHLPTADYETYANEAAWAAAEEA